MKPDDRIRLRHIVDALNSTIRFTAGRRRGDLDEDEMLAFALVHTLPCARRPAHSTPKAGATDDQAGRGLKDISHSVGWTTRSWSCRCLA
jgi:hypothetical protein